jgi:1-acyl-sn-glycerol-3-phosphate acyltransferase
MSSITLLLIAIVLLASPWLLMPRLGPDPEIRGLLRVLWWINAAYCAVWHRLETGRAPLPIQGPAILIANHTCGIDHMLLQAGSQRVLGFMIAQEFFDLWACRPFCRILKCIPVRRDGRDLAATRAALRALEQGRVVPIFPEGRILPKSGREIGPGKPGAAYIALRARVPVIPAYIRGTPETNDVFKSLEWPSQARVVYGPPVDLSDFPANASADRAALALATDRLMAAINSLREYPLIQEAGLQPSSHQQPIQVIPEERVAVISTVLSSH